MRVGGKPLLSLVAIYAIALHTILWGAGVPYAAGPGADPFSVICHSAATSPAEQAPADPASVPAQACDHCTLCSAMAAPDALDGVVIAQLTPMRLLQVLHPAIAAMRDGLATNPHRARGPPSFA